jgi:hypothetical protein
MRAVSRSCIFKQGGILVIRPNSWKRIRAARPDAELPVLDGPHLVLQVSPQQATERLLQFCIRCDPSYQP